MNPVIVIGGGPGGSTAAWYLRREGIPVTIIEKETFPRYCVGESLLPMTMGIWREMGFDKVLAQEGFIKKFGAVFGDVDAERLTRINFGDGFYPGCEHAYQVPRDRFDMLLLSFAKQAGAEIVTGIVREALFEQGQAVGVQVEDPLGQRRDFQGSFIIDASGRNAFLGRKLGLMRQDPRLDTTAIFGLWEWIDPPEEAREGDIFFYAVPNGWMWFIPFADRRTSVGMVIDRAWKEAIGESSLEALFERVVQEAGGRVARHLAPVKRLSPLHTLNRFNIKAERFSGPGWVLIGDAAMFIDPVFSAGVHVASTEAREIARLIAPRLLAGEPIEPSAFDGYTKLVEDAYDIFRYYIFGWRDPVFRKLFCNPSESEVLLRTITTILSGGVFDRKPIEAGHRVFGKIVDLARSHAGQTQS